MHLRPSAPVYPRTDELARRVQPLRALRRLGLVALDVVRGVLADRREAASERQWSDALDELLVGAAGEEA